MSILKNTLLGITILVFESEFGFSQSTTTRNEEPIIISNSRIETIKTISPIDNNDNNKHIKPARQTAIISIERNAKTIEVEKKEEVLNRENRTNQQINTISRDNNSTSIEMRKKINANNTDKK